MGSELPALEWRSWLPESAKDSLQKIFFFNPRQAVYHNEIVAAVDRFGEPQIQQAEEGLMLVLPKLSEAQCLFAIEMPHSALSAVVLFTRDGKTDLEILHLAISEPWQTSGDLHATTMRITGKMMDIAHSIRGIEVLRLPYGRGCLKVCH